MNQKGRLRWGGLVSHIPFQYAFLNYVPNDTLRFRDGFMIANNLQIIQYRIFEDQIVGFAFYPFSTTRRLEASASMAWYYYRIDAFNNYYNMFGVPIDQQRERLDAPPGFNLQRVSASYVGDNSFFGIASPIRGQRYRFGVEQIFGSVSMTNLTADYRRYIFAKPFTFAFRGTHYGRYGKGADDQNIFYPLYLGYPGFVRGLDYSSLYKLQGSSLSVDNTIFDYLLGSKVILAGAEIRFPLTGPERLALIRSGILFTEFTLFFDAGVAWKEGQTLTLNPEFARVPDKRYPFFSIGPSIRINVFGALILEPFYAFPFQTGGISKGVWGLNFLPGW
jgi:outer membrane protein assembly factor BamA